MLLGGMPLAPSLPCPPSCMPAQLLARPLPPSLLTPPPFLLTPPTPAVLPSRLCLPRRHGQPQAVRRRLLCRHEAAVLPRVPQGNIPGPDPAARLQALPRRSILPQHQDHQPRQVPRRHLQQEPGHRHRHLLRQVPHQRERWVWGVERRHCCFEDVGCRTAPAVPAPGPLQHMRCAAMLATTAPALPHACPPAPAHPPTSLPSPPHLQSFSNLTGQQACKKCSSGSWTGRLTGQTKCWSTSQALPNQTPATRRR